MPSFPSRPLGHRASLLVTCSAVVLSLLLSSCIDEDVTLYLNPDGSGKMVIITRGIQAPEGVPQDVLDAFAGEMLKNAGQEALTKIPAAAQACAAIENTEGIETWTNFRGSAGTKTEPPTAMLRGYFRDVNQLFIAGTGLKKTSQSATLQMTTTGNGSQSILPRFPPLRQLLNVAGGQPAGVTGPISEAAIKAQIATLKTLAADPGNRIRFRLTVQPAGSVTVPGSFKVGESNQASITITSAGISAALDLLSSNAALTAALATGRELTQAELQPLLAALLGNLAAGPLTLQAAAGKPQFDYADELTQARQTASPEIPALLSAVKSFAPTLGNQLLQRSKQSIVYYVTVYPNGDGRLILVRTMPSPGILKTASSFIEELQSKGELPQRTGLSGLFAAAALNDIEGIEGWASYACKPNEQGADEVVINGYFKDVNQLKLGAFRPPPDRRGPNEPATLRRTPPQEGHFKIALTSVDPFGLWSLLEGDAARYKSAPLDPVALKAAIKDPPVLQEMEKVLPACCLKSK